jgi:hypothetical protein
MAPTAIDLGTLSEYSDWLSTDSPRLSSHAQTQTPIICIACGKGLGTDMFGYDGQTFRLPQEEVFAFLGFIVAPG